LARGFTTVSKNCRSTAGEIFLRIRGFFITLILHVKKSNPENPLKEG
jgi:hypothetical protein